MHELNRVNNVKSALIQPFSDEADDFIERPTILKLTEAQYNEIFFEYKKLSSFEERIEFLLKKDQEFGLSFDPEEILELCVDEILVNEPVENQFHSVLRSADLRWIEIVRYIEESKYINYGSIMRPAIQACGYALE